MNKKITLLTALAFSAAIVTASVFAISSAKDSMSQLAATDEPYTLTLNDSNSPTISGTEVTKDFSNFIQLRYAGSNMSTKSERHIVMGNGGTITTTKQIRKITRLEITAPVNTNNKLAVYAGYTAQDIEDKTYAYPVTGTSKVTLNLSCNYFQITSSATFGISQIIITYECPTDESSYVKPIGGDVHRLVYNGGTLTYNDGVGTLTQGQTIYTDSLGSRYSYTTLDYSMDVYYDGTAESISSYNLGIQVHKHVLSSNNAPSAAFQVGPVAWSGENNIALKVSGTTQASGTYELTRNTWYTFRVTVAPSSTSFIVTFYINGTEVIKSTRGNLGFADRVIGIRQDSSTNLSTKFRNVTLTGSN